MTQSFWPTDFVRVAPVTGSEFVSGDLPPWWCRGEGVSTAKQTPVGRPSFGRVGVLFETPYLSSAAREALPLLAEVF